MSFLERAQKAQQILEDWGGTVCLIEVTKVLDVHPILGVLKYEERLFEASLGRDKDTGGSPAGAAYNLLSRLCIIPK